MKIKAQNISASGLKLSAVIDGQEVGRVFLYVLRNDLHAEPFGLLEDLFVVEAYRRQGVGTELIKRVIAAAKENGCYKLIGTSRYGREQLHEKYLSLGFQKHGVEFRMDF